MKGVFALPLAWILSFEETLVSSVCVLSLLGTEQHLTCVHWAVEGPRESAEVCSPFGSVSSEWLEGSCVC